MRITLDIATTRERTRTVRGTTAAEVLRNLPRTCWGSYQPNLSGDWNSRRQVEALTIAARPIITLPHWPNYRRASDADKRAWDDMITALRRHEEGHHAVFIAQVNEYKARLEEYTIPLEADEMQADWDRFRADVEHFQDRYDETTRNGQRDGVRLVVAPTAP